MGMVVRTNTMSLNAYRQLGMNNSSVSKSLEKLSSGFRINRAGDDASGLAISEKMKAQIAGLEQAAANSQDGISLIQTAEGATTEIHNMLNRMVTLATKSANGTIQNEVDRENIQTEVDALKTEITRIAKSTNFNGINLLDGSLGGADPILTGGAKFEDTKATLGSVSMEAISGATFAADDQTLSYTVNWSDANGNAQSTDVTFTRTSATEAVSANGTTLTLAAGAVTNANLSAGIVTDLGKNEAFSNAFKVTNSTNALKFEAKTLGASGESVTGVVIGGTAGTPPTTGSSVDTVTAGLDAGKKLDVSAVKVALNADSAADMAKKVFTVDGKKFLAVGAAVTSTQIAALDKDINIIQMADDEAAITGAGTPAADVQSTVDAINRAFGKTGSDVEYTRATANNNDAGIAVNDILFNSKSEGLKLQVGDTNSDFNHVTVSVDNLTSEGLGINSLDVSSQTAAGSAIETIKSAINQVSTNRGNLGALQNRLEYTINNLDTTNENMTAANSRIRDTDMAKEMMNYTKMNILTQAAQAMLAQANQQPQSILQLLQ